ncbi:hypothetical protein J43TS9_17850 [Paenibacillus cineris]|nr:hypothetical protein J43TS9_17850 [Paenibacillus cineris]
MGTAGAANTWEEPAIGQAASVKASEYTSAFWDTVFKVVRYIGFSPFSKFY